MEGLTLKRYFAAVVTGEDVTRNKPDPEGIQMVLKRMEVRPSRVIMVGDSASDIQAREERGSNHRRSPLEFEGDEGRVGPHGLTGKARFRISNSGGI